MLSVLFCRVRTVRAEVEGSCSHLCLNSSASVTVDAVDTGEWLGELWHCLYMAAMHSSKSWTKNQASYSISGGLKTKIG